jgi:5-formaminoimidazole-4-carboxamide-1-(beta)-D-ribofuranosyl 5'-monophosphate synthetase
MLSRETILSRLDRYDPEDVRVGVIGSHSALDAVEGAVEEGIPNLVVAQEGRHRTYDDYFATLRGPDGERRRGVVDDTWVLDDFEGVMEPKRRERLVETNTLWIPNRSFVAYTGIDDVEDTFDVPMVGSRNMLRTEERSEERDYYWLLDQAGLPFPEPVDDPSEIDRLAIAKLHHAEKELERGFFTAASTEEFWDKAEDLVDRGVITREALEEARIEEYVIGPVFNFDFFYSPLEDQGNPIELLGVDWRFETGLDGHVRLPADQQLNLPDHQAIPELTVVGHNTATLRESQLEKVFEMAETFVEAAEEHYDPGIIGPFCLQTCVDEDLNFYIYDVAPRIGGGTNVHMQVGHPYGNTLWREEMSTGRRLAREVERAAREDRLDEIVT